MRTSLIGQVSKIKKFKTSTAQYCNCLRKSLSGEKKLQSTKQVKSEVEIEEDKYFYPVMDTVKAHKVCVTIVPFNTEKKTLLTLQEPSHTNKAVESYMSWSCMIMIVL